MRYYNRRYDIKLARQPGEGVVAVPLREIEARLSEELRDRYGDEKIDAIAQKVRERSININRNSEEKAVYVHNAPLVFSDIFREMFPEHRVSFQP